MKNCGWFFLVSLATFSAARAATTPSFDVRVAEEARYYTVHIQNDLQNVFDLDGGGGSGTGIIADVSPERVYVLTNRHVISRPFLSAQRITVSVATDEATLPEEVQGKVVFVSPLYDFAVVEFDPRRLTRAHAFLKTAPFSNHTNFKNNHYPRGTRVMAYGHPLGYDDTSTYGSVSSRQKFPDGLMIQTSAPINPGNSGGPLVELEDGKVIGMNTLKQTDGEGLGFAIPFDVLIHEFYEWLENRTYQSRKSLRVNFVGTLSDTIVRNPNQKLYNVFVTKDPSFFATHKGFLTVTSVVRGSTLELGDILYSCNGITIGVDSFKIVEIAQRSRENNIDCEVIRGGKFVKIKAPLHSDAQPDDYGKWNFVLVSGMLIGEAHPTLRTNRSFSGLQVYYVQRGSVAEAIDIRPGSLVSYLQFPTEKPERIRTLANLKKVLAGATKGELLRWGINVAIRSDEEDAPNVEYFSNPLTVTSLTMADLNYNGIITPNDLDLGEALRNFDFDNTDPNASWRDGLTPKSDCEKTLKGGDEVEG